MTVNFIAIDGHGGSGKSTLAQTLSRYFEAEVIHIDDFTGQGASDDWYKKIISNVLEPIAGNAIRLNYACAKWWPEHEPDPVVNQPVTPIMIIEGVGACRKELRNYMTVKIFVETPREICIERGLARDRGMGGKSDKEIIDLWNQWLLWDDEYFAKHDPKAIADVVVNGSQTYNIDFAAVERRLK